MTAFDLHAIALPAGETDYLHSAAKDRPQDIDATVVIGDIALLVAGADDDDLGADRGALVEVLDILVHHADAAG